MQPRGGRRRPLQPGLPLRRWRRRRGRDRGRRGRPLQGRAGRVRPLHGHCRDEGQTQLDVQVPNWGSDITRVHSCPTASEYFVRECLEGTHTNMQHRLNKHTRLDVGGILTKLRLDAAEILTTDNKTKSDIE